MPPGIVPCDAIGDGLPPGDDEIVALEDAYILFRLKLHSRSVKKTQVNPAKVYSIDVGLVRAASRDPDANRGHLLENMVFLQMLREGWKMGYVVTEKGGHEVDFYAAHPIDKRKRLVQVSYEIPSSETLKREVEALSQAGEELGVDERLIVTWDDEAELTHLSHFASMNFFFHVGDLS